MGLKIYQDIAGIHTGNDLRHAVIARETGLNLPVLYGGAVPDHHVVLISVVHDKARRNSTTLSCSAVIRCTLPVMPSLMRLSGS